VKPRHAAALAVLLGLVIPATCEAVLQAHPFVASAWLLLLWPSSIQLMVLENRPPWTAVVGILAISIGINMLIYAGIGWAVAFFYLRFRTGFVRPRTQRL
jgi:hypothetical protein